VKEKLRQISKKKIATD